MLGVDADIDEVRFLWRSFTFACNDAVEYVAVQDEIYWAEFVIDREQKRLGINVTVTEFELGEPSSASVVVTVYE